MSILQKKEIIAVVRVYYSKEEVLFSYVLVEKKEEEIELLSKSTEFFKSVSQLKEKIKELPVIVLCVGRNLLYTKDENFFKFSKNEFYSSFYKNKLENKFLTLVRKNYIDELVEEFILNKLWIIDLYIGVFSNNLLFKEAYEDRKVKVDNVELIFDDEDCIDFNKSTDSIEENAENEEILSLSTVYNHFYPSEKLSSNYINEKIESNKGELKEKKVLELIGKVGFPILFILISIAYVLGMIYTSKNEKLTLDLFETTNKQTKLKKLLREEVKRDEILSFSGFYKENYLSFYINTIVKDLPSTIVLSGVNVFPKEEKILSKDKKNLIDNKLIVIGGEFVNDSDFNKWVLKIKGNLKVRTIDIVEFKKKKRTTKFKLNILL